MRSYYARYNPLAQWHAGYAIVKVIAHYGKKALIMCGDSEPTLVYRCNLDEI